jgi:hypothetical protein
MSLVSATLAEFVRRAEELIAARHGRRTVLGIVGAANDRSHPSVHQRDGAQGLLS